MEQLPESSNEPGPSDSKDDDQRQRLRKRRCMEEHEPGPSHSKGNDQRQRLMKRRYMEEDEPGPSQPGPSHSKGNDQRLMKRRYMEEDEPGPSQPGPSHSKRKKRSTCDLTEEPSRCAVLTDPVPYPIIVQMDVTLPEVVKTYMISLIKRLEEGQREDITGPGTGTSFNRIYTMINITEGYTEGVNTQHEVWQLEKASKMETTLLDQPIMCSDIFSPLPGRPNQRIRTVLTMGIAGIGKTFSVYKFILDWAQRMANQHIDLLIPMSFRELNEVRDQQHSLLTLIHAFHPTLKIFTAEQLAACKTVFIFDGLDQSRMSMSFYKNDIVSDVTVTSSVGVLLTNLIRGHLLPSALLWITTRHAAANQIPPECLDRMTEVRGFTDTQKEEFFRNRFSDEKLASRIISHINTSRSLHIMCHIPLFCWPIAVVLEDMLSTDKTGKLSNALTEMLCHFLLVQTRRKKQKYGNEKQLMGSDWEVILKLGRLAFDHLEKGRIIFYQEDLEECGLDLTEAVLYSGLCTEIFKTDSVLFQRKVYTFVHLTIQEFLAAVYLFHCFTRKKMKILKSFLGEDEDDGALEEDEDSPMSLDDFLIKAILKAQKSRNGHLDLLVRFLHGLSLPSNQSLLGGLLDQTKNSPEIIQRAIKRAIKCHQEMDTDDDVSDERCFNIYCCLIELGVDSVQEAIQQFLMSDNRAEKELSEPCRHTSHSMELSSGKVDHHHAAGTLRHVQRAHRQNRPPLLQRAHRPLLESSQTKQTSERVRTDQTNNIRRPMFYSFKFHGSGRYRLLKLRLGPRGDAEVSYRPLSPQESICLPHCDITPEDHPDASPSQTNMLFSMREKFIAGVSQSVIYGLIDKLFGVTVLNDGEMEEIRAEKTKRDQARKLIDMVRGKGNDASSKMIVALYQNDPSLYNELGLPKR